MTDVGGRIRPGEAAPLLHAQVARAASGASLRALAIKGPALAVQGLRTARDTADVDVLVHPDELGPLVEALRTAGWRELLATTAPSIMPRHSVSVLNDHWPLSIDVHHYFPGFLADPGQVFDVLWARHEDVALAGVPVPTCDRVAHVALVALHHLRDQRAGAPLHPELVELRTRARSTLSLDELDELVEVARELGAVATLRSFLVSLGVPSGDLDGPAPEEELALWNLRVSAPHSYPWLLHLRQTPLGRWPREVWRAVMLTEDEIRTFHDDGRGTSSVALLRWRRMRRGLRSVPQAVVSRASDSLRRRLRPSTPE